MEAYLQAHDIHALSKEMLEAVIEETPDDPVAFLIVGLGEIRRLKAGGWHKSAIENYKDIFINANLARKHQQRHDDEPGEPFQGFEQYHLGSEPAPCDGAGPRCPAVRAVIQGDHTSIVALRRGSVSAECMEAPENDDFEESKIVVPKPNSARLRIEQAIHNNMLFKNLDEEQKTHIINAMFEKTVSAAQAVIRQGEAGDNFYVIDSGSFDVFVDGEKKVELGKGQSFGELALMYNTPRAATVVAREDATLWAVDRLTFRKTINKHNYLKRKRYEGFLRSVPILSTLSPIEVSKIADCLEPIAFQPKQTIMRQGDIGDAFYIIVKGEAVVLIDNQQVNLLGPGDYFGEMALINHAPRRATIMAQEEVVKCVSLDSQAFIRLFGPLMDILKRNMAEYEKYKSLCTPTPAS